MPAISGIVSALSTSVVAALAAAGYPPLTDGKILIGRQHIFEQSAPPRIVFVPVTSAWGPRAMYSRANINGANRAEVLAQTQQRSVLTETVHFEVHVWGQASPPDPEGGDFDATQALYQAVVQATHLDAVGSYRVTAGTWGDQQPNASQLLKAGHEFVFGLEFDTPVLDALLPLAPSGTKAVSTTNLQPSDGGAPEVGCSGG